MRTIMTSLTAVVMVCGLAVAGEIKSGIQVGDKVPGPFEPINITGESAGEKACLFCRFSGTPTTVVFARAATPEVQMLLQKIDGCCQKNTGCNSYVVFLSDETGMQDKLQRMAKDWNLKKLIVALDKGNGPKAYNISADAEVTVMSYGEDRVVKCNKAYKKGEMCENCVAEVVKAVAKNDKK